MAADFEARFGTTLDEDALNQSHQIIIVAASLDASTERIVAYLNDRGIAINVLCFQVFSLGDEQLISRSWLLDPVQTQVSATSASSSKKGREREPWIGESYANFDHGHERRWEDARTHGFISAGGGAWYSNTLNLLSVGDRIWVNAPKLGYVGVGRVTGPRQSINEFQIATPEGPRVALEALTGATYLREFAADPDRCEYFVPVQWLDTVPIERAVSELGFFGNQNTVCKPTTPKWRTTVERLKERFPGYDREAPLAAE